MDDNFLLNSHLPSIQKSAMMSTNEPGSSDSLPVYVDYSPQQIGDYQEIDEMYVVKCTDLMDPPSTTIDYITAEYIDINDLMNSRPSIIAAFPEMDSSVIEMSAYDDDTPIANTSAVCTIVSPVSVVAMDTREDIRVIENDDTERKTVVDSRLYSAEAPALGISTPQRLTPPGDGFSSSATTLVSSDAPFIDPPIYPAEVTVKHSSVPQRKLAYTVTTSDSEGPDVKPADVPPTADDASITATKTEPPPMAQPHEQPPPPPLAPSGEPGYFRYNCDECGRRFANPSTLKTHSAMHSTSRDNRCEYCNQTFTSEVSVATFSTTRKHSPYNAIV